VGAWQERGDRTAGRTGTPRVGEHAAMTEFADRVDEAEAMARRASGSPVIRGIARSGYVASGLLRGAIGVLALLLAVHVDGAHPGASGAFDALADVPGGFVLLVLVAAGNGALFLWLLVQGALFRHPHLLERWRQRLVYWGRGAVYGVIGLTALRFALGAHAMDSGSEAAAGRQLLEVPGGRLALGVVAGIVLVVGGSMVWLGLSRRFVKTIHVPEDAAPRRFVLGLGVLAYVAQGGTILLVGGSLLVAAWSVDPGRVGGLDSALAGFPASGFGQALLVAIGVGWIVAGLYALLRARIASTA
jgi:hypothetical protein